MTVTAAAAQLLTVRAAYRAGTATAAEYDAAAAALAKAQWEARGRDDR